MWMECNIVSSVERHFLSIQTTPNNLRCIEYLKLKIINRILLIQKLTMVIAMGTPHIKKASITRIFIQMRVVE